MDDNRNRPDIDQNERTRQIPVQRNSSQTRQIPVQRTTPQYGTRPVQRTVSQNGTVQSSQTDNSQTRQIPAQRTAPKSGARLVQRTVLQNGTVQPSQTDNSQTRQIPVQRTTPKSGARLTQRQVSQSSAVPKTTVSTDNSAINSVDLNKTRQVSTSAVNANASVSEDNLGTKVMKTPVDGTPTPKKKLFSFLNNKKEYEDDGSAVVSIVKAVIYIVAVLVISISASLFIILVSNDVYAFVKSDEVVEVTIPENADINDIASILSDSGIIKYPGIFKMYANHNDDDGEFVAGKYSIASNLDYEDLLGSFKEQIPEGTTWVTIPEGYTTDEIIDLLVESGIGTKENYIDIINNYPFDYWFVEEIDKTDWKSAGRFYRLDGYLFPDTYEFYSASSEKTVINKLLARFSVIFGEKYREAAANMNMTTDEIVIIASMIEKEAGQASDYHLVSSVFHNRLSSDYFPKLQSDATVLYAIHHDTGERPTTVTPEDNNTYISPYNTYLNDGLPPGPIANPSASSINAALTPENTNYYYFVSYGINTYFSTTKQEHEANIAMIKEMLNKANG